MRGQKFNDFFPDLIPQLPEEQKLLLLSARDARGIGKAHVHSLRPSEKNRAGFGRMVTQGYDEIKFFVPESVSSKLTFSKGADLSFPRRRESRMPLKEAWIPAFAGMTTG